MLVASDRIGGLDSPAAGSALASGFADRADVAVLPLGAGGPGLGDALAALTNTAVRHDGPGWTLVTPELLVVGFAQPRRTGWHPDATTADIGSWLREALEAHDQPQVVLDLTGITAHDAGVGLLAAGPVLTGRRLTGLVPATEIDLPATGATGMLARRAHGAGVDLADLLAADAELRRWIEEVGPGLGAAPGSGAAGGTGLVVLAAGGDLSSPTQYCYRLAGAARTVRAADLVVTGCSELSALDRGGEVVEAVVGWAEQAERPCIAFTTGTLLVRRELRTIGLEAAHQVPVPVTPDALTAAAARIAGGWFPGRHQRDVH